jgi:uncharacterized protein (TIGR02246 family)
MRAIESTLIVIAASVVLISSPVEAADAEELARINAIVTACERLEHDYALYRDRGDPEGFASIFTEDGEWGRPTTVLKGRDAIRDYIASSAGGPPEVHMQFQSTIQVTVIDDSTATGISYALVLEAPVPEDGLPVSIAGFQVASESRSTYKLTDEGWKIAKREYTTMFVDPE